MNATPTPGAQRAADSLILLLAHDPSGGGTKRFHGIGEVAVEAIRLVGRGGRLQMAQIIDEETGAAELIAALEDCLTGLVQLRARSHTGDYHRTVEAARAALARARGQP